MLEFGVRFTEDLYIKVSYDPVNLSGDITAVFGRGEEEETATDTFSFGLS